MKGPGPRRLQLTAALLLLITALALLRAADAGKCRCSCPIAETPAQAPQNATDEGRNVTAFVMPRKRRSQPRAALIVVNSEDDVPSADQPVDKGLPHPRYHVRFF